MNHAMYRIILIIIASLIVIIIVLLLFMPRSFDSQRKKVVVEREELLRTDPVFRKDGELQFRDRDDNLLVTISVEVADNDDERTRGLMDRDSLPAMSGMLFMFETEEAQSFWMRNTRFSLDIIYADAERKVVSISKNTTPYSLESILSQGPAMYVVEVPAGFADKYSINEQCRIVF